MKTELFFVRHGETDSNSRGLLHGRTDIPLTPLGESQAARVAEHLARCPGLSALYSSPLQRAVSTAQQIGRRIGLTPRIDDRLSEFDFGDLEGLTYDDLQVHYPELYLSIIDPNGFNSRFPNGESRSQLHARVTESLTSMVRQHAGERVVIVAHLVVIGSAIAHLTSGDPHDIIRYLVRNCSITQLEVNNTGPAEVHCLDDISHLE